MSQLIQSEPFTSSTQNLKLSCPRRHRPPHRLTPHHDACPPTQQGLTRLSDNLHSYTTLLPASASAKDVIQGSDDITSRSIATAHHDRGSLLQRVFEHILTPSIVLRMLTTALSHPSPPSSDPLTLGSTRHTNLAPHRYTLCHLDQ